MIQGSGPLLWSDRDIGTVEVKYFELLDFLKERKKWWIAPIVIILVLFGSLIMLAEGSAIAPFIYALF